METVKCRVVQWLALGVLAVVVLALLPTPHGWVEEATAKRFRRYLVTIPANTAVNLTGWTQTYVPLGLALFGRNPYILNFG